MLAVSFKLLLVTNERSAVSSRTGTHMYHRYSDAGERGLCSSACRDDAPDAAGGRANPPSDRATAGHQPRDLYPARERQPERDAEDVDPAVPGAGLRYGGIVSR